MRYLFYVKGLENSILFKIVSRFFLPKKHQSCLKAKIKLQEESRKLALQKAEENRKEQELQDIQDISKMISNVVKQKELKC